jgi:uncharacterized protein
MLTHSSGGYVDLISPAGIGKNVLVCNYDGKVYASDEGRMLAENKDYTYCLGDLKTEENSAIMNNINYFTDYYHSSINISHPNCSDCAFIQYCGSDPLYHYVTQGESIGNKSISGFCNKNMAIFQKLIMLYQNEENKAIFENWVFSK